VCKLDRAIFLLDRVVRRSYCDSCRTRRAHLPGRSARATERGTRSRLEVFRRVTGLRVGHLVTKTGTQKQVPQGAGGALRTPVTQEPRGVRKRASDDDYSGFPRVHARARRATPPARAGAARAAMRVGAAR
jgi:hypothetical protein